MNAKTARLIRRVSFRTKELTKKLKREWRALPTRARGRKRRVWENLIVG